MDLLSSSGGGVRLSSLWTKGTLLLAFTRHFGCPQCKELLDQLGQYRPALQKAGITVAVVTQAGPEETAAYCARYAAELTCLSDKERKAYTAYGLSRGTMLQTIFSLRVLRANARVRAKKGWAPQMPPPGQDALLMSGIFIIAPDGRIRLPYYYDDIADHPPLDLLLHGVMGVDWDRPFEGPLTPDVHPDPKNEERS
jgi:peroxiredoxin